MNSKRHIYSVGEVNRYIKNMFFDDAILSSILVRGEVSNVKYHSSGHIYFSLKDARGTISCVMFAGNRRGLHFKMKDGDKVVVSGRVDVYEISGRYQLYASEIELEGAGNLYEQFLRLKKELEELGMFDPAYKQPIPAYATRIGVVTAPTGAAIRDIQNIAGRRNPCVQLILCPAQVQGEGAAASIARGIRILDGMHPDVLIVGRGGGSIEDLWAFNEREVAEAIFSCRTPVISAVGHETDFTIADYVADLRAPTPSAAAELAVFDLAGFMKNEDRLQAELRRGVMLRLGQLRLREKALRSRFRAGSPAARLDSWRFRAAGIEDALRADTEKRLAGAGAQAERYPEMLLRGVSSRLSDARTRAAWEEKSLSDGAFHVLDMRKNRLRVQAAAWKGLNPLDMLARGFSFTEKDGHAVTRTGQVAPGDLLRIHVKDGTIDAAVKDTEKETHT